MTWWYVSVPHMTGAVRVENEIILEAPPIFQRFIGKSSKDFGRWMRAMGDFTFERMEQPPGWSNGKTADSQSANEGSTPSPGFNWIYVWGNNEKRASLKGRRCRIIVRGQVMRSVLVEFENGQREVVSYRALRSAT